MNKSIFWFRRDLRLDDNHTLFKALSESEQVHCIFIFDTEILHKLSDQADARVTFLFDRIQQLNQELSSFNANIQIQYGTPTAIFSNLLESDQYSAIYSNMDYEPYAKKRDQNIRELANTYKTAFYQEKDHVIFEGLEVTKNDGKPYTVFTPYARKWMAKAHENLEDTFRHYPSETLLNKICLKEQTINDIEQIGFTRNQSITIPSVVVEQGIIRQYEANRNFPAVNGTSRLGIHFRFGSISIRQKAKKSYNLSKTYLNELIWRDFYAMILDNFPQVADQCFKPKYEFIEWRNDETEFERWKLGMTGYPIVDAGMCELNATGFMHNRVRMITASFLTKHLLIDWRWGAAYFAEKLLDYDLASNSGGWQWAAGCGTDAAPYFRIFNPTSQQQKFDKERTYIKKWIPEIETNEYISPIVEHSFARKRCLDTYKSSLEAFETQNS